MFASTREAWAIWRPTLLQLTLLNWKVRYKKAHLGFLWAFANPLIMAFVLALVFSKFFKHPMPNFPAFLLVTLMPWWYFALATNQAVNCIWENAQLVQRSAFPRYFLPLSVTLSNLVNFLLSLVFLFPFLIFFDVALTPYLLLLPLVIAMQVLLVYGVALIVSVAYVFFHDIRYMVEAGVFILFYLSPVFYPVTYVSEPLQPIYALNPMAGILTSYRHVLFFGAWPEPRVVAISFAVTLVILFVGIVLHRRYGPTIADHL